MHCEFATPQGLTRWQNDQQKISKYQSVIEFLHKASHEETAQALQRIREADDVEEAVTSIADSRLLLSAPLSETSSRFGDEVLQERPSRRVIRSEKRLLLSPLEAPIDLVVTYADADDSYDDSDFIFEKQYMANAQNLYAENDIFVDVFASKLPLSRWTNVSTDERLMNHLVNLFFTWDNIVERAFYRPIFEEDIVALDPSSDNDRPNQFCSRFLVNALLAASCVSYLSCQTFLH